MEIHSKKKWHISDIIDLEYFLYKDAVSQSPEQLRYLSERDRSIFLNSFRPAIEAGQTPDRQLIIQAWLNNRREEEAGKGTVLPGKSFASLHGSLAVLFMIAGLIIGAGAGLTFLTYTGDRPLNVFVYLSVFVFFQILLLLLLFSFTFYRVKKKSLLSSSPLYNLIYRSIVRILLKARNKVSGKVDADRRLMLQSALGIVKSKGFTYGSLIFLPGCILVQLFGIGFNLGLLAATLLKVITTDIAFGWQSTLQLSPAAVHSLVEKIALPWTWLVGRDLAFPSLSQVEGSRIILKEGIYHLSTPDLASWWPFLCFAVLVYGMLPRLLLYLLAVASQRRHLNSLDFRQGPYEQLLLRMASPLVSTSGRRVAGSGTGEKEPSPGYGGPEQTAATRRGGGKNILVMIPDDIFQECTQAEVKSAVQHRFSAAIEEIIRVNKDYETDMQIFSDLKNSSRTADTDILLILEAWQPPITEQLNFIKNLRTAIGNNPCISIGLIGKPQAGTVFTPALEENLTVWTRKITALGDPCLYTVGLVNHAP